MKRSACGTKPGVVAPGARLEKLAGGFGFTEGPTCDAGRNLFFTDHPNDRILKWSAEGEPSTFLQTHAVHHGKHRVVRSQDARDGR